MASLIQGYEYDIFISYRHNDNRSGWVTEFVKALQEEIAATIKEPISVYFDSNPHDGLLETHNVDKSLEGKLKCLIFIPIISQTYCDQKSFAWQYEFCAFNKLTKEDKFGKDIKLSNGNVTSRILPVKIHDLDAEDKTLLENEFGSVLRAIEFIYKEPGVNRPLKSSDNRSDNQSKTDYRNQVNKLANAVKEIIASLKNSPNPIHLESIATHSILKPNHEKITKSIAVLPFVNMSSDLEQEYFCDGITEEMINTLATGGGLRVIARTSAFTFKNSPLSIREIGDRLQVNYILEGSIRKSGDNLRLITNLIDAESEDHIWSGKFKRKMADIFTIQEEIAKSVADRLKVLFKENSVRSHTDNMEAFNYYLLGRHVAGKGEVDWQGKSIKLYELAIAKDPKYADAHAAIAFTAWILDLESPQGLTPKINKHASLALQFDKSNAEAHAAIALSKYHNEWKWQEAENEFIRAIQLNPCSVFASYNFATFLSNMGRGEDSLVIINKALRVDPLNTVINQCLGWCYYTLGKYELSGTQSEETLQIEPTNVLAKIVLSFALIELREFKEALKILQTLPPDNLFGQTCQVWVFAASNEMDRAIELISKLSKWQDEIPAFMVWMKTAVHDLDEAYHWLGIALEKRDLMLMCMPVFKWWDPLRGDPRFDYALDKTGLQHYLRTYSPLPILE